MEIWSLGTFEVSCESRPVPVRGALPRRLLALLSLTPGQEVTSDRLIDGLWGDDAPDGASATLQSHVARLRRDLPQPQIVRTGRKGYVLDLEPDSVDACAFEQRVAEGTRALAAGRYDDASAVIAGALQLWRGTPYAEFAGCEPLEAEAERLSAVRLDAIERRISADMGRPGVAPPVAELEALVRWHPLRESFWALLMAAQYRAGRQADALASYQRIRGLLAEELGVDPGRELQELERLILAQDPSLDRPGMSTFLAPRIGSAPYADRVDLVERDHLLGELGDIQDDVLAGAGRLVFVHGEAGAGKSALVRCFSTTASERASVLWGACDPLSSPRPLGPLVDVAGSLDARVGEMLRSGNREGLFDVFLDSTTAIGPVLLVIEDLHWADMSTLDLMRFLARRLEGTSTMVVATYRDEHLEPSDPLRVMLGDVASQPVVRRLDVPLLSEAAVAELAAPARVDAVSLYEETGGNPFFVTEVLASGGDHLPRTVQDAVLARVHRLSPQARLALESAAVIGSRAEPALLLGMPDVNPDSVDECVTTGMLRYEAPAYVFRHELVRQAVLTGVMPGRLGALHWQALDRLRDLPMSPRPLARLAEHADMAGDGPAVLEFAVSAGDLAAGLGSHREAAFQYGRAMPHLDLLGEEEQISLLGRRAAECAVADDHPQAVEAWQRQLGILRDRGRVHESAAALLGLDESFYVMGDNTHGTTFVDDALGLLEGTGPSPELAIATTRRGVHFSRACEYAKAVPWLERGIAMGRAVGGAEAVTRGTANLGISHYYLGEKELGLSELDEALRLSFELEDEDTAARVLQNRAFMLWLAFDFKGSHADFEEAVRYASERDQHGHLMCALASEVSLEADLGWWDEAETHARDLLYVRNTRRASRCEPLTVLGLLALRRGDRDTGWRYLNEASEWIAKSPTLGYQGVMAVALGEAYLLDDDTAAVERGVLPWYREAERLQDEDTLADLTLAVWRAGLIDAPPDGLREPELWSMTGRHREAAEFWSAAGAPYRAAWALLDSDDEVDLREARARFVQLGASVLVERTDAKLRSIGARVPKGARASTRANLGGLTDREVEVLALLDQGLRNADIAERLYLSEKTVGHHVSAILSKLGASSRLEAVARARELSSAAS